jgi:uncharacterized protein GlcG (DUF336 family)
MPTLTLQHAAAIVDAALDEARARNLSPLCVCVMDAGAHLLALKREDGASFMRVKVASAKATGALGMGFNTRELARRFERNPTFYAALSPLTDGVLLPSPGGVLIYDARNEVIGAVGVTGDTGDADEACAEAGIRAAGLRTAPQA